jgi:hypothetical protein
MREIVSQLAAALGVGERSSAPLHVSANSADNAPQPPPVTVRFVDGRGKPLPKRKQRCKRKPSNANRCAMQRESRRRNRG